MMVLWEYKNITVKEIGKLLYLDSGTLTPMLKKMEHSGWIQRKRSKDDERVVNITITKSGELLQEQVADVPLKMAKCIKLENEEAMQLYTLLNKMMQTFK